ncbi:hypothetical protein MKZ38_002440 [Zalerion maritima]|uniref:Uncharacterized protein n=1 Tax=Zalerion maritima TaxID=339359 RepID=A0AAD5RQD4_9PEZI|nr:hypothetical protein MKZ38_002440 [Zalerion maritima]
MDALCLNQKNWPEKSRELPNVGAVYARAETVLNSILRKDMVSLIQALSGSDFLKLVPPSSTSSRIKSLLVLKQLERNLFADTTGIPRGPWTLRQPQGSVSGNLGRVRKTARPCIRSKGDFPPLGWGDMFWLYPSRLTHSEKLPPWLPDPRYRLLPGENEIVPESVESSSNGPLVKMKTAALVFKN